MPPFVPRKRSPSLAPVAHSPPSKKRAAKPNIDTKQSKPSLFDTADAPRGTVKSLEERRKFLHRIGGNDEDEDDDEEEEDLSEADSDDFEDVPSVKRRKLATSVTDQAENDDDDEGDGIDWEDAIQDNVATLASTVPDSDIGDVSISMREDGSYVEPSIPAATGKKGPSKRERQIRVLTHCLHVQTLIWHNTVRNSWLNDNQTQKILVNALPEGLKKEVSRYKRSMGLLSLEELEAEKAKTANKISANGKRGSSKKDLKGRDWHYSAKHAEHGNPDLSHGDPILRLLKLLTAYWRKRFTITAPGLRKTGYMPLRRLREEVKGWEKDRVAEQCGERIENLRAFRELAKSCEGSRDVGAQLFIALLRGVGLEVRMVANLQPAGLGWSKSEEANPRKDKDEGMNGTDAADETGPSKKPKRLPPPKLRNALTPTQTKKDPKTEQPTHKVTRGNKSRPINLDDSDSPLSSAPSDLEDASVEGDGTIEVSDDMSVIDVTPASKKRPTRKYDRNLPFPIYWAEVLSPVSHRYIPVDPVVLSTIASQEELLPSFEPRGSRADKAKQVICYTIAFSADGCAKDVTVRYLKRHQLPGKTKGARMAIEKVPIYNRRGKVKKYEEYDWFESVMQAYKKPDSKRTQADDLEEQRELKPFKPSKEEKPEDKESLAWYKASAEFVLESHLRREEALLPTAKPVKTFTAGKGDKAKEYEVFRRKDVVACKTVESWHKDGRALKPGEQPMKYVPMRAVTLQRKREIEDAQRETGEKLKQGLYSKNQTDWIIPPPIEHGVIPRNAFGNIDVYVPTMVPEGAVHLPLRGSMKICKRLGIDFAEACTGFEFGKQRAVPVLTGVVVAEENESLVRDAWKVEQAEIKRKEDTKRTAAAIHWWRKMLMGLRILERMKIEYAGSSNREEDFNPFVKKALVSGQKVTVREDHEQHGDDMAGGFLLEDDANPNELDVNSKAGASGGGILVEDEHEDDAGGFLLEDDNPHCPGTLDGDASCAPVSLQSMHNADMARNGMSSPSDAAVDSGRRQSGRKTKPLATSRNRTRKTTQRSKQASSDSDTSESSTLPELSDSQSNVSENEASPPSPKVTVTPRRSSRVGPRAKGKQRTGKRSPYFSYQGNASTR